MALNNYAGLCTSVATWLFRDDLASVVPDFVTLAEAKLNARLRVADMEVTDTLSVDSDGLYELPGDLVDIKSVRLLKAIPVTLNKVGRGESGYSVEGNALRIYPETDATVEITYYQRIPALAQSSVNWLLAKAPQVYLYACLMEAAPFLHNDARIKTWAGLLDTEVNALTGRDELKSYGGVTAHIKGPVV